MTSSTNRNYQIDLIKTIAIISIVFYHSTIWQHSYGYTGSQYKCIAYIVGMGGALGNVLFILCSGYLLSEKKIKRIKALKLYLEVLFYSLLAFVLMVVNKDKINYSDVFMPFTRNYYWFFTSYIIVFLLLPYINSLLEKLDEKSFKELLITELLFFSIIPTLIINNRITGSDGSSCKDTVVMIMVYTLGYYIKKYKPEFNTRGLLVVLLEVYVIMVGSEFWLGKIERSPAYFVWDWSKTTVIIMGVLIFLLCIRMDIKSNFVIRIVKLISKHTFGIYIIHWGLLRVHISKLMVFLKTRFNCNSIAITLIWTFSVVVTCCIVDMIGCRVYNWVFLKIDNAVNKRKN